MNEIHSTIHQAEVILFWMALNHMLRSEKTAGSLSFRTTDTKVYFEFTEFCTRNLGCGVM